MACKANEKGSFHFLVTGGAGFIGSHIVEQLLEAGHKVRILDNFSTGKQENIASVCDKVEIVKADIRNLSAIEPAFKDIHYVLHQAALRSVPLSCDDPVSTNEVNVNGTLHVLMAARTHHIKRVVYASSSSVYGDSLQVPQREDQLPRPVSPYAVSKLTGEYYCQVFTKIYGVPAVSLRYFNVFGPRQDPASKYAAVVPNFLQALLKGKSPEIHGDGLQSRDFTYVGNVAHANIAAALAQGIEGEVMNVAMGDPHSVLDVLTTIAKIMKVQPTPNFIASRQGDVRQTCADISKLQCMVDIKKEIDFYQGMEKTVEWFTARYK